MPKDREDNLQHFMEETLRRVETVKYTKKFQEELLSMYSSEDLNRLSQKISREIIKREIGALNNSI